MMDGWNRNGMMNGGDSVIGGLMMLVFWIAIIVGIVVLIIWLVRQTQSGSLHNHAADTSGTSGETALDILKTRYAKGEIEKAEYEEKKKDLNG